MACRSGIGTTVSFGTSTTYTPLVRSIQGLSVEREIFDCTNMTSSASTVWTNLIMREYSPGDLAAPGQLTLGILFDPDEAPDIPMDAPVETITLTWKPIFVGAVLQTTPATCVFDGFVVSFSSDIEYEGLMEGTVVIQPTGDLNFTAGA